MPIEYLLLKDKPVPLARCPRCDAEQHEPLMRGQVQSMWRCQLGLPYCAVICADCKAVIGWEQPERLRVPYYVTILVVLAPWAAGLAIYLMLR